MTQDPTEDYPNDQATAKTRFQKVASALLGDKPDQDEQDRDGPAASGPGAPPPDYWDEPGATGAETVAVTRPDGPRTDRAVRQGQVGGRAGPDTMDHSPTEPDMFASTARAGNEPAPAAEGQPAAAAVADVPAAGEGAGTAGRHAAAPPADTPVTGEMRPGEATGALGDFSDLTYGNLVPDAEQYAAQWQQIQFRFVDDPQSSVTEAADIVAQVTAKMEAAIQERQRAVEERQHAIAEQQRSLRGRWGEGSNADTEALRETLRMYKTFLDQLIGPRAS
jgi:hypothetical protein